MIEDGSGDINRRGSRDKTWLRWDQSEIRQHNKRNADEGHITTMTQCRQDTKMQSQRNKILRHDTMETKRHEYRQKAVQSLRLV